MALFTQMILHGFKTQQFSQSRQEIGDDVLPAHQEAGLGRTVISAKTTTLSGCLSSPAAAAVPFPLETLHSTALPFARRLRVLHQRRPQGWGLMEARSCPESSGAGCQTFGLTSLLAKPGPQYTLPVLVPAVGSGYFVLDLVDE